MGRTGHWPVPFGDSPNGMAVAPWQNRMRVTVPTHSSFRPASGRAGQASRLCYPSQACALSAAGKSWLLQHASMKAFLIFLLSAAPILSAIGQSPVVNRIQPLAVAPGKATELSIYGEHLSGARLWTSFTLRETSLSGMTNADRATFLIEVPSTVPIGIGAICIITTNGISGWQLLLVDKLPSLASSGRHHSITTAQEVPWPIAVDGVVGNLASDYYKFTVKKGQRLSVDIVAQRLGSPLDPLLRLLEAGGRELASVEDTPGLGADGQWTHRFANDGLYFLEVRDTAYGGSTKHRYRMRLGDFPLEPLPFLVSAERWPRLPLEKSVVRISEREPNDTPERALRLEIPSEVTGRLERAGDRDYYAFQTAKGERLVFRAQTRSLGSPCDLFLQIEETNGARVAEASFNNGEDGNLTNTFAKAGSYRLLVEELNRAGGPNLNYHLLLEKLLPGFSLSTETARVSAPPGETFDIVVSAVRREYTGPIQLSLAGLSSTFTLSNAVIGARTNQVKLTVRVPESLELGQFFPFAIFGEAIIDGQANQVRVSTMPALRREFPEMPWPPEELDGWIALGVGTTRAEGAVAPPKRRKK